MISNPKQSILCSCPSCSEARVHRISAFQFPRGVETQIHCSDKNCDFPYIKIKPVREKYRITVACPICPDDHTFTINQTTLWDRDFFILNCPQSGIGIFFAGKDENRLTDEYYMQNDMLAGLMAEEEFENDELDLLFEIFERINTLAQADSVSCSCGSDDISIKLNFDSVILKCNKCQKELNINVNEDFLTKLTECKHFLI